MTDDQFMLVDDFAPNAPFSVTRSMLIDGEPREVMQAALNANLADAAIARFLTGVREVPRRLVARLRRQPLEQGPERISFGDIAELEEWQQLGFDHNSEWVGGAIGRFWQRDYGWVRFAPEDFVSFAEPGYAKTVVALRAEPVGATRTRLVYESRTLATDEQARRKFSRYWFVLRPFVTVLLASALRSIRREASRVKASAA